MIINWELGIGHRLYAAIQSMWLELLVYKSLVESKADILQWLS
ncbi:hypothetical protein [Nostoc sp.]